MSAFRLLPGRRREVAYHEAGHAVAALMRGSRVERLTIVPAGDLLGCTRHQTASWDQLFVAFAGPFAEAEVGGWDLDVFLELAEEEEGVELVGRDDDGCYAFAGGVYADIWVGELREVWPQIQLMAEAVLRSRRRHWTGAELLALYPVGTFTIRTRDEIYDGARLDALDELLVGGAS